MKPQFCVSDLHMGDLGPRDNFAAMSDGKREAEFNAFLDYVESEQGELTIVGDLFELWQGNVSRVLTCRMPLLDRLADMGTRYLLGNHDIDLKYFTASSVGLSHPLFADMRFSHTICVGDKRILLIHGHEQDPYCCNEVPDFGRISAIYTGLKEDRNGGPLSKKYRGTTIENQVLGKFFRVSALFRRLRGKPSHSDIMRQAVLTAWRTSNCHALLYGHTHEPGQFVCEGRKLPIYNLGTWAEHTNTFARVSENGEISLLDWVDGQSRPNTTKLPV